MFTLSDDQLAAVMTAAGPLPPEKRGVLLERIATTLKLCGPHFTDADLDNAIRIGLQGLIQSAA